MNFSPQQNAIVSWVGNPANMKTPLVVMALAGAGKTTTILEAAYRSRDATTLLCAFNKRIADELIDRLDQRPKQRGKLIKAQTLHSIGLEIIRATEGRAQVDRDATDHLVTAACPDIPFALKRAVIRTVRYLKETCSKWDNTTEVAGLIANLGYDENLPKALSAVDVALRSIDAMRASFKPSGEIDFCDMIWRPYALNLMPKGRFQTVIVDEAQDMTIGQFSLVDRLVAPGGRVIVVGDLNQEINRWRGAAGEQIWQTMRERKAIFLPLTWSFRCAKSIVRSAKVFVPEFDTPPDAPEGKIDSMEFSQALPQLAIGDFFLSRNNSGAVMSAIRAQLRGAVVRVLGGYEELDPLIKLLKELDTTAKPAFLTSLIAWKDKELKRKDITDAHAERVEDRFALLSEAAGAVEPRDLAVVLRGIYRPSDQPAVIFSTVHKVKGQEANRVFLLRETFARHRPKYDGTKPKLSEIDPEELCIEYVAQTRARSHLTWVLPDPKPLDERKGAFSNAPQGDVAEDLVSRMHQAGKDYVNEFPNRLDDDDPALKDGIDLGLIDLTDVECEP